MQQFRIARGLLLCAALMLFYLNAEAQSPAASSLASSAASASSKPASGGGAGASDTGGSEMDEIRRQLRQQQQELERMRALVVEQSGLIESLRQRVEQTEQREAQTAGLINANSIAVSDSTARTSAAAGPTEPAPPGQDKGPQATETTDARLRRVEEQTKKTSEALSKQLGNIAFSGDVRVQYDTFRNQLNATPNAGNPAIVGNELSARNRLRLRARLALRGTIGKEFSWGLRFSTGSLSDVISANQILTDFYNRKQFALDQGYLAWTPQRVPGLRLQGGKFEAPWLRTEMTFDVDIQPEGLSQSYSRDYKHSAVRNLTLVSWELPFLERASAFVRNPNGTVNLDQSRRNGRDLALYGAQARVRLQPSKNSSLTLAASDLYYSGTQFITPIQFFGNQLQIPVTVTIPANGSTPAQTVTGTATITRDVLVAGNGNLGLTTASNNAINRDGHLASGFNLADFIARLDLAQDNKRFPVSLILDFVNNTQAHDVVTAGPGGADRLLRNKENKGFWAEVQVGKTRERGDIQVGYTFTRIQKDAVLTPFNFSDFAQQSDMRSQRINLSYTTDPHVTMTFTGLFTQRPNGLLGVFGATPPGSLNRPTVRLQFDTIFRF